MTDFADAGSTVECIMVRDVTPLITSGVSFVLPETTELVRTQIAETTNDLTRLADRRDIENIQRFEKGMPRRMLHSATQQAELRPEFHNLISADLDSDNRLASARAALFSTGIRLVEHPVTGDPATGILDVADEVGTDLVVVGARGLGAAARFMRGSVSTRVAHHSRCDVLVVEHDHDDGR